MCFAPSGLGVWMGVGPCVPRATPWAQILRPFGAVGRGQPVGWGERREPQRPWIPTAGFPHGPNTAVAPGRNGAPLQGGGLLGWVVFPGPRAQPWVTGGRPHPNTKPRRGAGYDSKAPPWEQEPPSIGPGRGKKASNQPRRGAAFQPRAQPWVPGRPISPPPPSEPRRGETIRPGVHSRHKRPPFPQP